MNTGSLLMMLGMVLLGVVGRIMTSQALDGGRLLERPNDFRLQRFIHISNDREKYSDA